MLNTHTESQMTAIADILNAYLDFSLNRDKETYNEITFEDMQFLQNIKSAAFVPPTQKIVITTQVEEAPKRIVPIIKDWKRDWTSGKEYDEFDCRNIIRDYITHHCQSQVRAGFDHDTAFEQLMNSKIFKGHKQHIQNTKTGIRIKVGLKYTLILKPIIPPFDIKKGNRSHKVLNRIVMK